MAAGSTSGSYCTGDLAPLPKPRLPLGSSMFVCKEGIFCFFHSSCLARNAGEEATAAWAGGAGDPAPPPPIHLPRCGHACVISNVSFRSACSATGRRLAAICWSLAQK